MEGAAATDTDRERGRLASGPPEPRSVRRLRQARYRNLNFDAKGSLHAGKTKQSLDNFLSDHPTGQAFAQGWQVRMELFRAVGVWPGTDDDMQEACRGVATPKDGPTVAITIGTAYLRTAMQFLRVNKGLERQFLQTPDAVWGTALANVPQRLVVTLSIWENAGAAVNYMRTGAHGAAVKAHFDPKKDRTGHTFTTGGGFFGLRLLSTSGSLPGRNPISAEAILNRS